MRAPVIAAALIGAVMFGCLGAAHAQKAAPAKPYRPVVISPRAPQTDSKLEALRKAIVAAAETKDRAALGKLVAPGFFWLGEEGDKADKNKPSIDNLLAALNLAGKDEAGWQTLGTLADDRIVAPFADREGVMCGPADPEFDEAALDKLAKTTGTEVDDWGYPLRADIDVRARPNDDAAVIGKVGPHFVRVMPDDGAPSSDEDAADWARIALPDGKVGFAPVDSIRPLGGDQLCYSKGPDGSWTIAGLIGGAQKQP